MSEALWWCLIILKSSFPQRKVDLQSEQQATAVSVTLDRVITICSVYIPPHFSLISKHLDNLLQQLPSPYITLGELNGHNILSGSAVLSGRVLDLRPKGLRFEPHWRHCVVSLSKNINPSLVLAQPRKTGTFINERLLMGR